MRLAVLSRKPSLYTTSRLTEAAKTLGHSAIVLDPLHCRLTVGVEKPMVTHRGKVLSEIDAVLPRIGNSVTEYGLAVVRHFELAGITTINRADSIQISRDKFRTLQILRQNHIRVPTSVLIRSPQDVTPAVDSIGGYPVVVKLLQGTQGIGVMRADSASSLESILDTLWGLEQNVLLQKFVAESDGCDLRAIVVGNRVVGAMRRKAPPGQFRANIHRGAAGSSAELDPRYTHAALDAMRVTGLQVGGVDMLETVDGPLVLEVNSSPGFEGLEAATGIKIAEIIIEFSFKLAAAAGVAT